ncbi:Cro/Cl family transcriptional regulator [Devosia pacifica]|uniref:Cro/Cl family transcriptional regulator n=1 Tax=Devosia pacifica TaxID=1335967 RepID=A0A918SCW8_9HYPH|nr:XRE family transcriptional regulator [Devosia pacifica]GHA35896.1 Cro/Cl family transcriptional regulator [Devosia pacifica]
MRAPIGLRISTRRKALEQSQAGLARQVGISPSYLNLIEANKREVGGTLLRRIAEHLGIDVGDLTGESEHRLIHELEEALADPVLRNAGLPHDAAHALVAQNPAVAQALVTLYRAYASASATADAYAHRLRTDPLLSELLHQVLSGITGVRSSAEILEDVPDLDEPERDRFIAAIGRETRTLSEVARNLIGQFDNASETSRSALPRRELDDLIFASDNHFPALEAAAESLRAEIDATGPFGEETLVGMLEAQHGICVVRGVREGRDARGYPAQYGFDEDSRAFWFRNTTTYATRQFQLARLFGEIRSPGVLDQAIQSPILTSNASRSAARRALSSYLAGALVFPYLDFFQSAEAARYDIDTLRERYSASFEQVAHRLVTLRHPRGAGVPFGFLRSDPAGRLTKHFPLPGLLLPSSGHACPLWAIFTAFRTPDSTVRQVVQFSSGSRYMFIARTTSKRVAGFSDQAMPISVMLACDVLHADRTVYGDGLDLADARADVPVGPACRLCTRIDCPSRQEPALTPSGADEGRL